MGEEGCNMVSLHHDIVDHVSLHHDIVDHCRSWLQCVSVV